MQLIEAQRHRYSQLPRNSKYLSSLSLLCAGRDFCKALQKIHRISRCQVHPTGIAWFSLTPQWPSHSWPRTIARSWSTTSPCSPIGDHRRNRSVKPYTRMGNGYGETPADSRDNSCAYSSLCVSAPLRSRILQSGKAKAMYSSPEGVPILPPPAAMTTYCFPLTM